MLIEVEKVKIKKRVRVDLGDIEALMDSLSRYGLIHPVTVNHKMELISGFRRLESAKRLGWKTIEVKMVECHSRDSMLEREIEENLVRKDFSDNEIKEAFYKLQKMRNPNIFVKIIRAIIAFFKNLLN